jgi:hypothetical protein
VNASIDVDSYLDWDDDEDNEEGEVGTGDAEEAV